MRVYSKWGLSQAVSLQDLHPKYLDSCRVVTQQNHLPLQPRYLMPALIVGSTQEVFAQLQVQDPGVLGEGGHVD
jgi:hypothetical protein